MSAVIFVVAGIAAAALFLLTRNTPPAVSTQPPTPLTALQDKAAADAAGESVRLIFDEYSYRINIGVGKGRIYKDSKGNLYQVNSNLTVYRPILDIPYVYYNTQDNRDAALVITSEMSVYSAQSITDTIFTQINLLNGTLNLQSFGYVYVGVIFFYKKFSDDRRLPNVYFYTNPESKNTLYLAPITVVDASNVYLSSDSYKFNPINLSTGAAVPAVRAVYSLKGCQNFFNISFIGTLMMNTKKVDFDTTYLYENPTTGKLYLDWIKDKGNTGKLYMMVEIKSFLDLTPVNHETDADGNLLKPLNTIAFVSVYGLIFDILLSGDKYPNYFDLKKKIYYGFYGFTPGDTNFVLFIGIQTAGYTDNWRISTDGVNFILYNPVNGTFNFADIKPISELDPVPEIWTSLFSPDFKNKDIGQRGDISQSSKTKKIQFMEIDMNTKFFIEYDKPFDYRYYPEPETSSASEIHKMLMSSSNQIYDTIDMTQARWYKVDLTDGILDTSTIYYFIAGDFFPDRSQYNRNVLVNQPKAGSAQKYLYIPIFPVDLITPMDIYFSADGARYNLVTDPGSGSTDGSKFVYVFGANAFSNRHPTIDNTYINTPIITSKTQYLYIPSDITKASYSSDGFKFKNVTNFHSGSVDDSKFKFLCNEVEFSTPHPSWQNVYMNTSTIDSTTKYLYVPKYPDLTTVRYSTDANKFCLITNIASGITNSADYIYFFGSNIFSSFSINLDYVYATSTAPRKYFYAPDYPDLTTARFSTDGSKFFLVKNIASEEVDESNFVIFNKKNIFKTKHPYLTDVNINTTTLLADTKHIYVPGGLGEPPLTIVFTPAPTSTTTSSEGTSSGTTSTSETSGSTTTSTTTPTPSTDGGTIAPTGSSAASGTSETTSTSTTSGTTTTSSTSGSTSTTSTTTQTPSGTYNVGGHTFNSQWNPITAEKKIMMNTSTVTSSTKYLYVKSNGNYISDDGVAFSFFNTTTNAADPTQTIYYLSGAGEMQYLVSSDASGNYNAPEVMMNAATVSASTAFFFILKADQTAYSSNPAPVGTYFVSTDGNDANNGGAFKKMQNLPLGINGLNQTAQSDVMYTDLKSGGFLQYPSTNPNHTADMKILMNTPTIEAKTIYGLRNPNGSNAFQDWGYSTDGLKFYRITSTWVYQNEFKYETSQITYMVYMICGHAFNSYWTFWSTSKVLMSSGSITPTTFYLYRDNEQYFLSSNQYRFNIVDISTATTSESKLVYNINGHGLITFAIATAPAIYMNAAAVSDSNVFIYKSKNGKVYFSNNETDVRKGKFYEITSISSNPIVVSSSQTIVATYTDLEKGGFFEYPSINPNHSAEMQIFMNTPTVQAGVTQYLKLVPDTTQSDFDSYMVSKDGIKFSLLQISKNTTTSTSTSTTSTTTSTTPTPSTDGGTIEPTGSSAASGTSGSTSTTSGSTTSTSTGTSTTTTGASTGGTTSTQTPGFYAIGGFIFTENSQLAVGSNALISSPNSDNKKGYLIMEQQTGGGYNYYFSSDNITFNSIDIATSIIDTEYVFYYVLGYGFFKTEVGNTAPSVYMNQTTVATSTAFLYKSKAGVYYLSNNANQADNGGKFYQITNFSTNPATLSTTQQTTVLYTDLANGGFFEYPSANSNHKPEMQIFMNTPTVQAGVTKYVAKQNSTNNFQTYSYSTDGIKFSRILTSWIFQGSRVTFDNTNQIAHIINNSVFRSDWNPITAEKKIMMNTSTVTSASNYLYLKNNAYYLSTNGVLFNLFNLSTSQVNMSVSVLYVVGAGEMQYLVSSDASGNYNAPEVMMNAATVSASTAFFFILKADQTAYSSNPAPLGTYFVSTDGNDANNGGAFKKMQNLPLGINGLNQTAQSDVMYTDLKSGGFLQYPSTNPNHTADMKILMNTPTIEAKTIYGLINPNSSNMFQDSAYSNDGIKFYKITSTWMSGSGFAYITGYVRYLLLQYAFNPAWIFLGNENTMMNTSDAGNNTKYVYRNISNGKYYFSTDSTTFNLVNTTTATLNTTPSETLITKRVEGIIVIPANAKFSNDGFKFSLLTNTSFAVVDQNNSLYYYNNTIFSTAHPSLKNMYINTPTVTPTTKYLYIPNYPDLTNLRYSTDLVKFSLITNILSGAVDNTDFIYFFNSVSFPIRSTLLPNTYENGDAPVKYLHVPDYPNLTTIRYSTDAFKFDLVSDFSKGICDTSNFIYFYSSEKYFANQLYFVNNDIFLNISPYNPNILMDTATITATTKYVYMSVFPQSLSNKVDLFYSTDGFKFKLALSSDPLQLSETNFVYSAGKMIFAYRDALLNLIWADKSFTTYNYDVNYLYIQNDSDLKTVRYSPDRIRFFLLTDVVAGSRNNSNFIHIFGSDIFAATHPSAQNVYMTTTTITPTTKYLYVPNYPDLTTIRYSDDGIKFYLITSPAFATINSANFAYILGNTVFSNMSISLRNVYSTNDKSKKYLYVPNYPDLTTARFSTDGSKFSLLKNAASQTVDSTNIITLTAENLFPNPHPSFTSVFMTTPTITATTQYLYNPLSGSLVRFSADGFRFFLVINRLSGEINTTDFVQIYANQIFSMPSLGAPTIYKYILPNITAISTTLKSIVSTMSTALQETTSSTSTTATDTKNIPSYMFTKYIHVPNYPDLKNIRYSSNWPKFCLITDLIAGTVDENDAILFFRNNPFFPLLNATSIYVYSKSSNQNYYLYVQTFTDPQKIFYSINGLKYDLISDFELELVDTNNSIYVSFPGQFTSKFSDLKYVYINTPTITSNTKYLYIPKYPDLSSIRFSSNGSKFSLVRNVAKSVVDEKNFAYIFNPDTLYPLSSEATNVFYKTTNPPIKYFYIKDYPNLSSAMLSTDGFLFFKLTDITTQSISTSSFSFMFNGLSFTAKTSAFDKVYFATESTSTTLRYLYIPSYPDILTIRYSPDGSQFYLITDIVNGKIDNTDCFLISGSDVFSPVQNQKNIYQNTTMNADGTKSVKWYMYVSNVKTESVEEPTDPEQTPPPVSVIGGQKTDINALSLDITSARLSTDGLRFYRITDFVNKTTNNNDLIYIFNGEIFSTPHPSVANVYINTTEITSTTKYLYFMVKLFFLGGKLSSSTEIRYSNDKKNFYLVQNVISGEVNTRDTRTDIIPA